MPKNCLISMRARVAELADALDLGPLQSHFRKGASGLDLGLID